MRLALFEPDIPQNTGTMIRLAQCLGVPIDIIEPCGFVLEDKQLRRAGMDYLKRADLTRHNSWQAYEQSPCRAAGRLVLLTTRATLSHLEFSFMPTDTLLVGRESAGVPGSVHGAADARLRIPMAPGERSLNVAMAAAIVLGEALRQTAGFPEEKKE
ncbi:MAG: tRNA (cytidine(34)-2'-O)-methyltransferase [Rhodospirillales bacterium]|nr:tRNA (cytidine(34)-2'-O)-methyltransferase [Rhodospirillales bacterium]